MGTEQEKSTSGDLPLFTASAINLQATAWILKMTFGEVGASGEAGHPPEEIFRVAIGLPWPFAKIVHEYMGLAIAAFEKQEGPITVPKTVRDRLAAAIAKQASESKPPTGST